jgi:hypothetical protein
MILQAALAIVDRDGVDRLSMRRLSNAVGRDPVMLYRHVPNKATSSTNCRRSSSGPRKPTMCCGSVCTAWRSPNSPSYVHWRPPGHLRWRRRTRPRPRSAAARPDRHPHPPRRITPNHLSPTRTASSANGAARSGRPPTTTTRAMTRRPGRRASLTHPRLGRSGSAIVHWTTTTLPVSRR